MGGGTEVTREGTSAGDRGVGEDEGNSGRIRGRRSYGLLKGVASYSHPVPSQPPIKKPHFASSTTISQPPLQKSIGPKVSEARGQATGPASSAVPPAPEETILAHM